jgi:hypothetical protein
VCPERELPCSPTTCFRGFSEVTPTSHHHKSATSTSFPALLIGVLCKPTPGLDSLHRFLSFQFTYGGHSPVIGTWPQSRDGRSVLAELHPGLFVMFNINMYFMRAP